MTARIAIASVAALAALGTAVPAAGAAPTFRSAAFEAELRGTQVSTWEYHEDTLKDDRCGSKQDGYGDQTLRFGPGPDGRLVAFRRGRGKPTLAFTAGGSTPGVWSVSAEAQRTGTWIVDTGTNRDGCGENGGDGAPGRRDEDCGARYGWIDPSIEARGGKAVLGGRGDSWAMNRMASILGDPLDDLYKGCEFWVAGPYAPEVAANLHPTSERLPMSRLFGKRKRIVVDFGTTKTYAQGGFTGKTITTAKLVLKRTKVTPPAGVGR